MPGGNDWLFRRNARRRIADTSDSRYCYSVWLRHLVLANQYGVAAGVPNAVAELGPGDSLGTGLAALLSGAKTYYAFDVVNRTANERNIKIFEELITLFKDRENIPDSKEFPTIKTKLDSYKFPSEVLSDEIMDAALKNERIDHIKTDLIKSDNNDTRLSSIRFVVPWNDKRIILESSIDMIFSMSVLEHIDDIPATYQTAYRWLKKHGFMSHEIDYKCHGHHPKWNGHWTYSDLIWRIIRGNRHYLINREPHSTHIRVLRNNNFQVIADLTKHDYSGIRRNELSGRFKNLSNHDLCTCNTFLLSVKN